MHIDLYDTTLRDGAQGEGVSFTLEDKLQITESLARFGIRFIEGGWPGANPKDARYFQRLQGLDLAGTEVTAFSYTGRPDTDPAEDPNLATLLAAETRYVTVVGKSWDMHVEKVLRTDLPENLRMIRDTVAFLRREGRRVFYDAEQFFDGHRANPEYALSTLEAARDGGAEVLVLCDTNGGSMPWAVEQQVRAVADRLSHPLGIHAHNDCELGVANALAAVRAGATQIQGTFNGIGERVGNANLTSIIPILQTKMGITCVPDDRLPELMRLAHHIARRSGRTLPNNVPFVGLSAFTHKAGLHADATRKLKESYQHMDPARIGNRTRIVVSELSGKGNILMKAEELGIELDADRARRIASRVKELEADGYSFENADASVALLIHRTIMDRPAPFHAEPPVLRTSPHGSGKMVHAVGVRVSREGRSAEAEHESVERFDAAWHALLKALRRLDLRMDDVAVAAMDQRASSDGRHAVTLRLTDGRKTWNVIGAGPAPFEAEWTAIVDGIQAYLIEELLVHA